MAQSLLVVGGNGFLGSAVCKAAVKKGWKVTSISSSGRPFRNPKGHSPAWVSQVEWKAASAFEPVTYRNILSESTAVVHTIGTLFENTLYKRAVQSGSFTGLLQAVVGGSGGNPLTADASSTSYQRLNHDSALTVLNTYLSTSDSPTVSQAPHNPSHESQRTFVYISAEDIFSAAVPRGYILSKRAAERDIAAACRASPDSGVRSVSLRPGLMYHPHLRPLTTPIATLLSASAQVHKHLRANSTLPLPTPAGLLQMVASRLETSSSPSPFSTQNQSSIEDDAEEGSWLSTALRSSANAMQIPPMHVDHVALAACLAIETSSSTTSAKNEWDDGNAILGVSEMREMIGWSWDEARQTGHGSQAAFH